MKILQLGKAYPPANLGGVEIVIQLLTEGLNQKGVECDALGVNETSRFKEEPGKHGGKIIRTKKIIKAFSTLFSLQLITKLYEIKTDYNIIHIHSPDPMAALALLISKPDCKIVLHWHSDILRQKLLLFFYEPILLWLLKRSDLILATSPNYVSDSRFLKKYREKVDVLPIGIDVEAEDVDFELEKKLRHDYANKKLVFAMGRLAYYKGYEFLIKAMALLPDHFVLIIAGDGEERKKLSNLIIELNLGDRVKLYGKVSDKEKNTLYRLCDVFALSSIYKTEAYAIVQVEAMAFGKPIVSTKIPGSGVDWVNKNGESGFTVPICDERSMATAIEKILTEPQYNEFCIKSRKRYLHHFTKEKMIDSLLPHYRKLLNLD